MQRLSRRIALVAFTVVLAHGLAAGASPREREPGRRYALETLDAMAASGRIDEATRGLLLLRMLRDPSGLPAELRVPLEPDLPCLTPHLLEAIRASSRGGPAIREEARRLLADPPATVGSLESESTPIRVLYQEEGDLARARLVLEAAEDAYAAQVEGLGWTAPAGLEDGEPIARLDIYFVDTPYGYSGSCEPLADNGLTSWTDALVRCEIDRQNEPAFLAETVAHELHHAVQFSEDAIEFMSAYEMFCVHTINATIPDNWEWMYFLPSFQEDPEYAIFLASRSNQMFHYGTALFAQFLDERFGEGDARLAPRLWRAARQDGTIAVDDWWVVSDSDNEPDLFDAIDRYLAAEHESSLEEALVEFAEWRLVLGANDDGAHFARGRSWTGAEVAVAASWDPSELPLAAESVATPPMPTGTSYLQVRTDELGGAERLRAVVDLGAGVRWSVQAIRLVAGGPAEVTRAEVVGSRAELVVPAAGARSIVLAVTNLGAPDLDPDDWPVFASEFTYGLELLRQPVVGSVTPGAATAGVTGLEIEVAASPLDRSATLDLGPGISVVVTEVTAERLRATIGIATDAEPGARDVVVTNPGSEPGVLGGGFEVRALPAPVVNAVDPRELVRGGRSVLTVSGAGFVPGAEASLGAGVSVERVDVVEGTRLMLTVIVSADAATGSRTLTISNPGGAGGELREAVTILGAGGCECRAAAAAGPGPGPSLLAALALLGLVALRRRPSGPVSPR